MKVDPTRTKLHKLEMCDTFKIIAKQFSDKKVGVNNVEFVLIEKVYLLAISKKTKFHRIVSSYDKETDIWIIYQDVIDNYIKKIL